LSRYNPSCTSSFANVARPEIYAAVAIASQADLERDNQDHKMNKSK